MVQGGARKPETPADRRATTLPDSSLGLFQPTLIIFCLIDVKIPLAWLQLIHERLRFWVALAGVSFADILMLMQLGFRDALFESATLIQQKLNADLVLANSQLTSFYGQKPFPRQILYQALSVKQVEGVSYLNIGVGDWKNPDTGKGRYITILGINPSQAAFKTGDVIQNLDKIKLPNVVLFDSSSRPEFGDIQADYNQGKTIETELNRRSVIVGGLYTFGTSFSSDGSVIVSDQNFLRIQPDRDRDKIDFGLVILKPGSNLEIVKQQLQTKLPPEVMVLTHQEFIELEKKYWAENTPIGFIFTFGTIIGFVVGSVIVYQILYADVSAHLSEYATLKAIGYRQGYLLLVVFQEALILAIIGYIPALPISIWLYSVTQGATQLPIAMSLMKAVTVLILTLLMCSLAGLFAVRRLGDADPSDIF